MVNSVRRAFGDLGLNFAKPPTGVHCIRPIGNSIGKVIVAKRPDGEERLSPETQLAPYSKRTSIAAENEWHVMDQALRTPKPRAKLLGLGAHHA